jgi:predicted RND superfamily exporter protein
MAINVYLDMASYHNGFDEQITKALDKAIVPLKQQLQIVLQLGDPSIRHNISQQIHKDLSLTLPLSLGVLSLTLWIILKRSPVTFIPLATAILSVIWILAVMSLLQIPLNVMTAIIPALLVIIGSTEDIHLISEYQTGISRGLRGFSASRFMAKHMGTAVLLTFITTSLGFLSISLNPIDLLQEFGLMAAIGLTLNFLITVTLVPASLQLISKKRGKFVPMSHMGLFKPMIEIFSSTRYHHLGWLFSFSLLIAICGYWANRMVVDNNVMDYLPTSSDLTYQADLVRQNLSGTQTLAILIDGPDEAFLKVSSLQQVKRLQQDIEEIEGIDKSFSFTDFIGVIHRGIDGPGEESTDLPDNDEVVAAYTSLISHASLKPFVTEDFNQTRIMLRHAISSSKELNQAVEKIQQLCQQHLSSNLNVKITGSSYLNTLAADSMADGQKRSLLLMLTIIFLLITFLLSSLKIGLIAVITNLFPVVILFAVMGYFNIALDTGTVMVAAIALGICVDHTMHFMLRFRSLSQEMHNPYEILIETMQRESRPIVSTALALTLGFATLAFSEFPPMVLFGSLSAMVMLLALVGTFVVTPYLLSFLHPPIEKSEPKRGSDLPLLYPDWNSNQSK